MPAPTQLQTKLAFGIAAPSNARNALPQGRATAINVGLPSLACSKRVFFVRAPLAWASARLKRLVGIAEAGCSRAWPSFRQLKRLQTETTLHVTEGPKAPPLPIHHAFWPVPRKWKTNSAMSEQANFCTLSCMLRANCACARRRLKKIDWSFIGRLCGRPGPVPSALPAALQTSHCKPKLTTEIVGSYNIVQHLYCNRRTLMTLPVILL